MKIKSKQKKIVKGWAYMADGKNGKYLIKNTESMVEIYLKKPPIAKNPFTQTVSWKPTKLEITYTPKGGRE